LDFPPGETSVASAGDEAGAGAGAGAGGAGGAAGAGEAMPPRGAANAPSRVSGRSAAVVVAGVAGDGVVGGERGLPRDVEQPRASLPEPAAPPLPPPAPKGPAPEPDDSGGEGESFWSKVKRGLTGGP